ncbi:MAG: TolC family protein [Candidatus Omnitrophica bacterium]|nr:TolC family protein [Candidatus Omnitrophota bacterium]
MDLALFDAAQREHLSEAHFSHLLNQSLETRYLLDEEQVSEPLALSRPELEQLAVALRPELRAVEIGIARAKAGRALAVTSWLPDLTGRIEARQFKGERGIREYDTFIGVTVPVWSLLKGVGGEWRSAGRDVQQAEALYAQMQNEVLLAVHEADAKVRSAENGLQAYKHAILPQAQQQVEVAFAAYEAGRTDFLNLIDAQRMLKDAQIAYYQIKAEHERGLSDLRLAVGGEMAPHRGPAR